MGALLLELDIEIEEGRKVTSTHCEYGDRNGNTKRSDKGDPDKDDDSKDSRFKDPAVETSD